MAHATTRSRACYLVRHAIAEPRGPAWPDDDERPLSTAGTKRMVQAVGGLVALGETIEHVLTSPLLRARQTADVLVRGLRVGTGARSVRLDLLPELAPGVAPGRAMRAVADAADEASVALVGHEPDLGMLAAWLLGTDRPIPFKKGGVCRIDVRTWPGRAGGGTLVWFARPRMLRRLGRR